MLYFCWKKGIFQQKIFGKLKTNSNTGNINSENENKQTKKNRVLNTMPMFPWDFSNQNP